MEHANRSTVQYVYAESDTHLAYVKNLFMEYAASLNFDLSFQDFEKEIADLPGEYSPPDGCIILAMSDATPIGCVAMRKIEDGICEMKRLYARPEFRGKGIGRELAISLIDKAHKTGYDRMRLDTVPLMDAAIELYRSLGFKEIGPYRLNPIEGAMFMELKLS